MGDIDAQINPNVRVLAEEMVVVANSRSGSNVFTLSRRNRLLIYFLFLAIVASICCFYRLSQGTLRGDEAAFAFSIDRMRATGDWVVPYLGNGPHLNATPLYNWLTLALGSLLQESPLWYRVWSAVFGIGCVLIAFALGTLLFRPEVGLLAGLFLAFNRGFLFDHGVRCCCMDATLAFFVSAAVLSYTWSRLQPRHDWMAWLLIGVCIGLACLTKPPLFGCYFFFLILVHRVFDRRREPFLATIAGPLLAAMLAMCVAGPWYFLMWSRLGNFALHQLFIYNSVERAFGLANRDLLNWHACVWHSSTTFKLIEVAMACALICWFARYRRPEWGILFVVGGGYALTLTMIGIAMQYSYYSFPVLAVLLSALFLESGPFLVSRFQPQLVGKAMWLGAAFAAVLLAIDCRTSVRRMLRPGWIHPPVGIYQRVAPEVVQGRCRFVLFDFPVSDGVNVSGPDAANFEDLYYVSHLPLADRVRDISELERLISDGVPVIVILPPLTSRQPQLGPLQPEVRIEDNPFRYHTYPVLMFNGASAKFPVDELIRLARGNQ